MVSTRSRPRTLNEGAWHSSPGPGRRKPVGTSPGESQSVSISGKGVAGRWCGLRDGCGAGTLSSSGKPRSRAGWAPPTRCPGTLRHAPPRPVQQTLVLTSMEAARPRAGCQQASFWWSLHPVLGAYVRTEPERTLSPPSLVRAQTPSRGSYPLMTPRGPASSPCHAGLGLEHVRVGGQLHSVRDGARAGCLP